MHRPNSRHTIVERLKRKTVLGDGGYLIELERRGYIKVILLYAPLNDPLPATAASSANAQESEI